MKTSVRQRISGGVPGTALRVSAILATAAVMVSCSAAPVDESDRSTASFTTSRAPVASTPSESADASLFPKLGGTEPGSLTAVEPFDSVIDTVTDTGATAYRIRYMSTAAIGGGPVEVTGSVFVPGGAAPEGGWKVVAFNHGFTGIAPNCGPSLYDDLKEQWLPIAALLLNNYLVVASDYEGLGGAGGSAIAHALLDAAPLGRNVIDGVRAAADLVPSVGRQWAAFGGSLGGLATWAANEQASTYGDGLDLVGAASWVPMVDASELPRKAAAGTLTQDQLHLYLLAIMSMKATLHPDLVLSDYVRGEMYEKRDLLVLCTGPRIPEAVDFLETASAADLVPVNDAAAERMSGWLREIAVPRQRAAAPMIVIYGSADRLVDQSWIESALQRGCELGSSISWFLRPGEGHGDIDAAQAFPWIGARFDGQRAENGCTR